MGSNENIYGLWQVLSLVSYSIIFATCLRFCFISYIFQTFVKCYLIWNIFYPDNFNRSSLIPRDSRSLNLFEMVNPLNQKSVKNIWSQFVAFTYTIRKEKSLFNIWSPSQPVITYTFLIERVKTHYKPHFHVGMIFFETSNFLNFVLVVLYP